MGAIEKCHQKFNLRCLPKTEGFVVNSQEHKPKKDELFFLGQRMGKAALRIAALMAFIN